MNLKPFSIFNIVIIFLICSCQKEKDDNTEKQYLYYKANSEKLVNFIETNGTIQPKGEVSIFSPTRGRIDKLFIEEGDSVYKGQVVAIMSSDKRVQILNMAANESSIEREYWRKQILPTKVFAPISGTVNLVRTRPGDTISGAFATIAKEEIVKANIDEIDISKVKLGSRVIVNFDADETISYFGKLKKISQKALRVRNVNVYPIEIFFEDGFSKKKDSFVVRTGMSVSIKIPINEIKQAIAVDVSAVNNESNKELNVVMNNGTTRKIKLGDVYGDKVHVIKGLKDGDVIRVKAFKSGSLKKNSILNLIK